MEVIKIVNALLNWEQKAMHALRNHAPHRRDLLCDWFHQTCLQIISISTHSLKSAHDNIVINNKIDLFFQIEFQYLAQKTMIQCYRHFGNDSVKRPQITNIHSEFVCFVFVKWRDCKRGRELAFCTHFWEIWTPNLQYRCGYFI